MMYSITLKMLLKNLKMNNIVVLGDGLLGSEIVNQTSWHYISRKKDGFDIINIAHFNLIPENTTTLINCIANTDSYSLDKETHWDVNYKGVHNLIQFCNEHKIKFVHISTDFIFANNSKETPSEEDVPVHSEHWYSYTKLLGDGLVQLLSNDYLLCRCTHKPYPIPYKKIFADRVGNFDYVNVIASLIIKLINKGANGVFNVGTDKKYMVDLIPHNDYELINTPTGLPTDTTMSISKMNNFLNYENG